MLIFVFDVIKEIFKSHLSLKFNEQFRLAIYSFEHYLISACAAMIESLTVLDASFKV